MNISSAFAGAANRPRAVSEQIASAEKRYYWWFDHPVDWERPAKTLYVTGWCVSQRGKKIRSVRARRGRQKFLGNYGIERKDVGAASERIGFAIAVPLPRRKSHVIIEVQESDDVWRKICSRAVVGAPNEHSAPPIDPKYFIPNFGANGRFEFWLDRPTVWPEKARQLKVTGWCFAISGDEITEVRARVRKKLFPARFGTPRPDIALGHDNRPGALRSGFSLQAVIPPGRSEFILEARSGDGAWEAFFIHPVRGAMFRELSNEDGIAGDYAHWIERYDQLSREDLKRIGEHIGQFSYSPLISVLLPVYNSNLKWLRRAISSVRKQLYAHWELCIADDASTNRKIWPFLERCARRDRRIKLMRRTENGHISAASNDALRLATGDFVALLDHDDELAPTALYLMALALDKNRGLQLLYSDEDKLEERNRRCEPYFKSDWNPELFLAQNFMSHFSVYRTDLIRRIGGFRIGFEGSQDYDLALRCIEQIKPDEIEHLPWVLYHWRAGDQSTASNPAAKPYAQEAAQRAVQEHLKRRGVVGTVMPGHGVYLQTKYTLPNEPPMVSIIIPTRDQVSSLKKCVISIFEKTDYSTYELILLDNQSHDPEALEFLAELQKRNGVRVKRIEEPFNYSRLNNIGVQLSRGSVIAFLNNDVEVLHPDWLSEMVSRALQPKVAMVGSRLWYPNGTIQHGGVILGAGGIAGHAHIGLRRGDPGYFARAHLAQDISAVTTACAVVKREAYLQVGGFDENLAVTFNDIDLCLRLREAGYRILWTPYAELIHHESASRGFDDSKPKQIRFLAEVDYMKSKWGDHLKRDPFYNPNLSLDENLFTLAFPPRTTKPWEDATA
ncbi:MAG TPA: glycosyltransferase family 2 protein [Candidatus Udaeobacter sp.]|nr:glycosyltransferase family 2 protein [Candidatus Udaeobacter sp.]